MTIYLDGDWCIYLFLWLDCGANLWCGDVLVARWTKRKGNRILNADLWDVYRP